MKNQEINSHTCIALITARGGSKGIHRKNIIPLAGKHLIAWTIEAALCTQLVSRLIVSTDDKEIADISMKYGAEVPFLRPTELAQDDTPHIDVVIHALKWLMEHDGILPDYLLTLQPTSPLRTAKDLDGVIGEAYRKNAEAVVAVSEMHHHPYLTRKISDVGLLELFMPCPLAYPRRQDLPPAYFINGAAFLNQCDSLLTKKTFYPKEMYPYIMPQERSIQIDTPFDMKLAEFLLLNSSRERD